MFIVPLVMAALPPSPPAFSWATVPVFMHSGNSTGPLSAAAAQYMARFPLVTMAGFHGDGCCLEDHITQFAASVKAASNASATVLYYQNTLINFPQAALSETVPPELLVHDRRGRLVFLGGCGATKSAPNHTLYDHTQPAMRALWVGNVAGVVAANPGLVDGVFCDRSGSIADVVKKDLHCYDLAADFAKHWNDGHWQTVADTQAALDGLLNGSAIVIGNHAEPEASMHLDNNGSWNGKMYEHFVPARPYVPAGDQLAAFKRDAQLVVEAHVDFCDIHNAMYKSSLAAFLIGATAYDYYACTNGWGFSDGWHTWSPDYDRPLGAPNGSAVRTKFGWRRAFASGTEVWLDTEDQSGGAWGSSCIRWADGHVTKSGQGRGTPCS